MELVAACVVLPPCCLLLQFETVGWRAALPPDDSLPPLTPCSAFGIPVVVAINRFATDTDAELEVVREEALKAGKQSGWGGRGRRLAG